MEYSLVTNNTIVDYIRKSKYFAKSLGYANTSKKGDSRILRDTDKFAFFYNKRYNTTIYGNGLLTDISVYTDHYIKESLVAVYYDFTEYIFNFDVNILDTKGIDFLIGSYLKNIEEKREKEKIKESVPLPQNKIGNPYKLVPGNPQYNPGSVTFEDLKAYQEAKRMGTI